MTSQKGPIPAQSPVATLGDVLAAVGTQQDLSETRRRDLRSAVNRVAALLGDAPERIPLVMPSISARLAKLSAAAAGVSTKTFHNLRSDFLAAVKASGLHSAQRSARAPLSPPWQALLAGAFDPTRSSRSVALSPLRLVNAALSRPTSTTARSRLSSPRSAPRRCIASRTTCTARSPRSGTRPRNAPRLACSPFRFLPSSAPRNARTGRRSAIPSRPMPSAISRGVPGLTCSRPMPGGAPWRRERFSCVVTRSMRP